MSYYREGCATGGMVLVATTAVGGLAWWLWTLRIPVAIVLLVLAGVVATIGALRLGWLLSPAATGRIRGSGGLGILVVAFLGLVIAAAIFS